MKQFRILLSASIISVIVVFVCLCTGSRKDIIENKAQCFRMIYIDLCNIMDASSNPAKPELKRITYLIRNNKSYSHSFKTGNHSWRFMCSYISTLGGGSDESQIVDISKNWDDESIKNIHFSYYCWNTKRSSKEYNWTNVMAVTGQNTAFELLQTNEGVSVENYGHLILLIEVAHSGTHWAEPGDMSIVSLTEEMLKGTNERGVIVCFLDGEIWYISDSVPLDVFRNFLTLPNIKEHDRYKELLPYSRIIIKTGYP